MALDIHMPFEEALRALARRQVLPTSLDSAALRKLGAAFHRHNFVSAQNLLTDVLNTAKEAVESILNPVQVVRPGQAGTVTEGYNPATAREAIREALKRAGYAPEAGKENTIQDLSSDARIDLVVKTNVELSQGAGHFVQQQDPEVVELYPALELVRFEDRKEPRDWAGRWRLACQVAGDPKALAAADLHGRFAAMKNSGVWQALGDGEGGYEDTLGNPFPPFAFNSGMWTQDLGYAEAVELGLLGPADGENGDVKGMPIDFANLFGSLEEVAS